MTYRSGCAQWQDQSVATFFLGLSSLYTATTLKTVKMAHDVMYGVEPMM